MAVVTGTYRLQLHAGFGFDAAARVLPFLDQIGVSHLYLSPILQAVAGSMHGYDVLDHSRVSDDLGGHDAYVNLATEARDRGLGVIVDVVPNHMAFVAPENLNRPLWDVLRDGRDAPTADWFDVDWKAGGGRIGLPILGDELDVVLAAGEFQLDELTNADGRTELVIRYHDHLLPVA
ncbi:MAG TPA: alpha-amylase family glycosyl hydrolase, partial [Propionibacteriaceae bacterium]|nr:alpha-amylase family glycosyl hydrolase [Propionibacteriaceae bacterium]